MIKRVAIEYMHEGIISRKIALFVNEGIQKDHQLDYIAWNRKIYGQASNRIKKHSVLWKAFKNRKQKSNVSSKASSVKEENDDSAEIKDESQLEPKDEVVPMEEDLSNDWK